MKKGIKAGLFFAILLCCVAFSGCSYSQTGIDSLLTPPKLSDQQNQIYSALEESTGKNIKLKYPRKGDFTSAFLINNIDGEPSQEAIVFFESATTNSATMPLRINVLDQENNKWVSKYEIGIEATEIDKVTFITSNQQTYIIVGYTLLSKTEKMVSIYTYADGVLSQTTSFNCMDYEVSDIDGDNVGEIISFAQKKSDVEVKSMTATLHKVVSSGTLVISGVQMDPDVSSFVNIQKGKLIDGKPAIYIDGLKGASTLCTQILAVDKNGALKNLTYDLTGKNNLVPSTYRSYGSLCLDLNKDGVYEIPAIVPSLGYEELPALQQQYLTQWYELSLENALVMKSTTYVSYSLGYIFTMPDSWLDKVRIDFVAGDSELSFYDNSLGDDYDAKIASIKVVRRKEYLESSQSEGYSLLMDNGQLVYTYKFYETKSKIGVWASTIKDNFALLPN